MGQLLLAETQLLADLFDRLRKILRCLCHIVGLPQFLVRHKFTDGERMQFPIYNYNNQYSRCQCMWKEESWEA